MEEQKQEQKIEVTFDELMQWKSALANCAIEGNKYAKELLEPWEKDRLAFIEEYARQRQYD